MKNQIRSSLMVLLLCTSLLAGAQVPQLSSHPSANAVILLDFDGHVVSGTSWNVYGAFTCNSAGLTNEQLTEVFNRVAEDFRPFNINVTTDHAKYTSAPAYRRIRILITTSHEWYGTGAGGVAFLNSFTWGDDTPAFVFSALLNYNLKNVAEAASHEAGHTLGLRHQASYDANCVKLSEYHWGVGSGEIGWAPIMGAGYSRNMTLWHNGPNSISCNNYQTDISIITNSINGFGFRTDDYSETMNNTTATAALNSNQQFTVSGVIEKTDDRDVFKFTLPSYGNLKLDAIPYNVGTGNAGSDLDLQVELFNSSQVSIGVYNPGTLLSSIIDTMVDEGTYYMRIDGKGNVYAPEYGSLGSYSLLGSFTSGVPLPLRRLELKGQLDRDNHSLNWLIDADEAVIRQVLEVSTDGRNFSPLIEPLNADRSYIYRPSDNRPLQYRLKVTLDNHKQYYSNTIVIRSGSLSKPQLIGNVITGNSVNVSSPAIYNYQVIDLNGRIMHRGTITKGSSTVTTGNLSGGMYLIRFNNNDEQWTEKFLKN